ncbi:hypothetical protein CERSUDRAFT_118351 [Gelatoporia subvermispora B]|uniref:Uncharacterized protein n=1 Tax=Ceriporiopsis subvermispora (strain B) TaxID=914234 RepID=M2R225_CERS8|nr:hypothetical protein CERSUDRAFT_118351 [Gelatoporia subvermispora B]
MASIIAFAGSKVITLILVNLPSSQSIHDLDLIALRPAQPLRTLTRYVLALFAPTTSDTIASSPSPASPQDADALILSTLARPITLAHLLSSALGVLGFVLAVVGLVAHTWEVLPGATSVTGTICAAVGVMAVVWIAL